MKYVTALVLKNVLWIADATSSVRRAKSSSLIWSQSLLLSSQHEARSEPEHKHEGSSKTKKIKNTRRSRETHKCIFIHIFRAPSIISRQARSGQQTTMGISQVGIFSGSLFVRAFVQIEQSHKVMAQVPIHSGHTLSELMENQAGFRRR